MGDRLHIRNLRTINSNSDYYTRALRGRHLELQQKFGNNLHSTVPPQKKWLQHFSKDNMTNPLLQKGWLPWARSVKYSGRNDLKVLTDDMYQTRYDLVNMYSFAIPCDEAVRTILEFGKEVLEIGSGEGYWASLLQKAGGSITAVDIMAAYLKPRWFSKTIGSEGATYLRAANGAANSTLLLCWPRVGMVDGILQEYKGDTVVWVGEVYGSCAEMPSRGWVAVTEVRIPHWACIYDRMIVYKRADWNKVLK